MGPTHQNGTPVGDATRSSTNAAQPVINTVSEIDWGRYKKWTLWSIYLYVACTIFLVGLRFFLNQFPVAIPLYLFSEIAKLAILTLAGFGIFKGYKSTLPILIIINLYFLTGGFVSPTVLIQILLIALRVLNIALIVLPIIILFKIHKRSGATDQQQIQPQPRWQKILSIVLIIIFGLGILLIAAGTILLGIFNLLLCCELPGGSFSASSSEIILSFLILLLPAIFLAVIFGIAIYFHIKRRYRISIALISLTVVILGGLYTYSQIKTNEERQSAIIATSPISAPNKGLLIPSTNTVPEGFTEINQKYTPSGYQITYRGPTQNNPYTNPQSTGYNSFNTVTITEHDFNDYNTSGKDQFGYPFGSYSDEAAYGGLYDQKVLDFAYQNEPGVVYATYPKDNTASTTVSYQLYWDDNNNPVEINADLVFQSQFSPQLLVAMLESMIRANGSTVPTTPSAQIQAAGTYQPQPISVSGMNQYTDSNFGFTFWYPSEWRVYQPGGLDNSNSSIVYLAISSTKEDVFSIGENDVSSTTDSQNTMNTTMGGLPIFVSSLYGLPAYIVPLNDSTNPRFLSIRAISTLDVRPILKTITLTNPSMAKPVSAAQQTAIIQSEEQAYAGQ